MTIQLARRLALTLAVLVAPWALVGCGDSTTTAPAPTTATPSTTTDGKPAAPPTAAPSKPAPR
jgi:hypothetical protein